VFQLYLSSYIQRREQFEYDSKKPLFDEIIGWFEENDNDDEDDFEPGVIKPIILPFPGNDQDGGSKEGSETESDNENVVKPFPPPGGDKSSSEAESANENVVKPFPPPGNDKTESLEATTENVIKPFPAPGNGK